MVLKGPVGGGGRDVEIISMLADVGFILPVLAASLLMLLARREPATALHWGLAVLLASAMTALLKTLTRGDPDLPHFPSGHVSLAVAFYGGLLVVVVGAGLRWAGLLLALAAVAVVEGVSRVTLTEHTWLDVAGGLAIGILALTLSGILRAGRRPASAVRVWLLATMAAAAPIGAYSHAWLGYSLRTLVQ